MRNLVVLTGAALLFAGCLGQQKQAEVLPAFENTGNPLVTDKFTADPAPMVYNGTLYLYVGHDEYYEGQDSASGGKEFNITEWLCYSTEDMLDGPRRSVETDGLQLGRGRGVGFASSGERGQVLLLHHSAGR